MAISRIRRSGITPSTTPKRTRSMTDSSGLPGPVQSLSASATGNATASVSWSAPVISGDSAITSYTVSGGGTASVAGTTASITGLTGGTSYSFVVTAVNSLGSGIPATAASITTPNFNAATGGTTNDVANYNGTGQTWRVHTFTSSGTFTVTSAPNSFSILLVGAGGNGGGGSLLQGGGGGRGGHVLANSAATLSVSAHSVTIGASNGANSLLGSLNSSSGTFVNGGGGGSYGGGAGNNGPLSTISGTSLRYAGSGGGGGGGESNTTGDLGGAGGQRGGGTGGRGAADSDPPEPVGNGGSGTANTGGGGGGGGGYRGDTPPGSGGSGGSGIVIVAYRIA